MLVIFLEYSGSILGIFWGYSGSILALVWGYSCNILRTICDCSGNILGVLLEYYWNILGIFWEHSANILGKSSEGFQFSVVCCWLVLALAIPFLDHGVRNEGPPLLNRFHFGFNKELVVCRLLEESLFGSRYKKRSSHCFAFCNFYWSNFSSVICPTCFGCAMTLIFLSFWNWLIIVIVAL